MAAPAPPRARPRTDAARRILGSTQFRAVAGTAGLNLVTTAIGSIAGLFLARALGPTARGHLVTILQWPAIVGSLIGLGITQSTCFWTSKRRDSAAAIMSTAAAVSLLAGLALAFAGPLLSHWISPDAGIRRYLILLFAISPLYVSSGVWQAVLQATSIAKWNVARFIHPALYFVLMIGFWIAGRLTLGVVVASYACALLFQTVYALVAAKRQVGPHQKPDLALIRPLYSYGIKVSLSSVPQIINIRVDQLILSVMPGVLASQLGNYAVAASLSWLALPVAMAFGNVAFPRIASATDERQARRIERKSLIGSAITASLSIGVISASAPFLVPRLFGKGYGDVTAALWLLAPGTVFLALNMVLGELLQGRGRPLRRSAGEGLGAILTVIMLVVLIPRFGIRGAAAASSVAYALVTLFLAYGLGRARHAAAEPTARVEP